MGEVVGDTILSGGTGRDIPCHRQEDACAGCWWNDAACAASPATCPRDTCGAGLSLSPSPSPSPAACTSLLPEGRSVGGLRQGGQSRGMKGQREVVPRLVAAFEAPR